MAPYIGVAKNIAQICRGAAKNFFWSRTSRGGPRVGMIFNPRGGGEGSDTNFLLRGERVGTRTKSQGGE